MPSVSKNSPSKSAPALGANVVMSRVLKGDVNKLKQALEAASPTKLKEYWEYGQNLTEGTLLEAAIKSSTPEVLETLIQYGAANSPQESTATRIPSRNAWQALYRRLEMAGHPEALPVHSYTSGQNDMFIPLDEAKRAVADQIFDVMLKYGVGKDDLKGKCWGPVHKMITLSRGEHERTLEQLNKMVEHGYRMNDVDEIGETPLAIACWYMQAPLIPFLIQHGASLTQKTSGGRGILSFVFRDISNVDKWEDPTAFIPVLNALDVGGYNIEGDIQELIAGNERGWIKSEINDIVKLLRSFTEQKSLEACTPSVVESKSRRSHRL